MREINVGNSRTLREVSLARGSGRSLSSNQSQRRMSPSLTYHYDRPSHLPRARVFTPDPQMRGDRVYMPPVKRASNIEILERKNVRQLRTRILSKGPPLPPQVDHEEEQLIKVKMFESNSPPAMIASEESSKSKERKRLFDQQSLRISSQIDYFMENGNVDGITAVNLTRKLPLRDGQAILSPKKSKRKDRWNMSSNQPREEKRAGRWTATSRELLSTSRRLKMELEREDKQELKALFQMTPQIARKDSEESQDPPSSGDESQFQIEDIAPFSPAKHSCTLPQSELDYDDELAQTKEIFPDFNRHKKFLISSPLRNLLLKSPQSMPKSKICSDPEEFGDQDSSDLNPRQAQHIMSAGPASRQSSQVSVIRHKPGANAFRTFIDVTHAATDNEDFDNLAEMEYLEGEQILSEHVCAPTSTFKKHKIQRGLSDEDINHSHFSVTRKLNFKMNRAHKKNIKHSAKKKHHQAPLIERNKYYISYLELKDQLLKANVVMAAPFTRMFVFLNLLYQRGNKEADSKEMLAFIAARRSDHNSNFFADEAHHLLSLL